MHICLVRQGLVHKRLRERERRPRPGAEEAPRPGRDGDGRRLLRQLRRRGGLAVREGFGPGAAEPAAGGPVRALHVVGPGAAV